MQTTSDNIWKQLSENGQFRWLFAGNTAMFFGFFSTLLLRSMLAWDLTGDEMKLAYINLVTAVCMLGTSLFAGAIIDRAERRRLTFIAQLMILLAEALILGLLITQRLTFDYMVLSAIAASAAFPFIMPSRTAMLVDAVGKRPLGKATAILAGGINVARMISPAAIGFLVEAQGFVYGYAFLLTLHLVSLICTLPLREYPATVGPRESFVRESVQGFQYIVKNRSLGMAILFGVLPMLVVVPLQNLMVVFVDEIWHAGGSGLGIMMATMGIGGLVGSLIMALLKEGSLVKPMVAGTLCMSVFLLLFSRSPGFWMAVAMVLGIYSCSVFAQTLVQTAVQLMADDYIRGRITAITMMSVSLAPLGTIPLAFASKHLGADWAMTIAALALIIAVILIWTLSPAFRRLDQAAEF